MAIYKTLHRKQKVEQRVVPVVLLLLQTRWQFMK